jgi:hypothetical protein
MGAYSHHTGAPSRCAYCAKPLPMVSGELQIWRDYSGQFFRFAPSTTRYIVEPLWCRRLGAKLYSDGSD